MKKVALILLVCTLLGFGESVTAKPTKKSKGSDETVNAEIGKTLPAWSEGWFDIHFINSARGECCFYILPDGTTLLVDAGEIAGNEISTAQRPNAETRPYITYARYIKHFLPNGKKAIDYCAPSHFHTDHIGSSNTATETSPVGYRKSGLLALYDEIRYNHILDRSYPHYTEDEETPEMLGQLSADWATFVTWGVKNRKFTAARFLVGQEQIKMIHNPKKHRGFSIFNICANGYAWGRDSAGEERVLGTRAKTGGNPASCGFHIKYGAFDYIACGDLVSSTQNRIAYYFRDFIGKGHLDAFKSHHHLAPNSWGSKMVACEFNPRIVLNHCFALNKPSIEKLAHVLTWSEGFYATNLHPDFISIPEVKAQKLVDKITAYNGHIVLRVAPGGEYFYVYMLDDSDFEYKVKFIAGPYKSK
jgi:beta-lactamase superfamily II metal-dependent hydrolase